jgi:spore coat protein U-like protein
MMRGFAGVALLLLAYNARPAAAASCSVSASGVAFGNYTATNIVNITGTASVTCTNGTAYHVGLNAGLATGATITNRSMTGPASALLGYKLFSDSGRTANWGNTSGTGYVSGTGNGSAQTLTIYAQIPASEFVAPGSYTDTIIVNVTGGATATTTFSVTSTVLSACTITANALNFGTYSGVLINSTSSVSVTCTKTTAYNVGLSAGLATGATVTNRSMTGPSSALLGYTLFSNAGQTTNWGNTVGTDTLAGTGSGALQALSVYGQVPAGRYVRPGSYTDTITATVTY